MYELNIETTNKKGFSKSRAIQFASRVDYDLGEDGSPALSGAEVLRKRKHRGLVNTT